MFIKVKKLLLIVQMYNSMKRFISIWVLFAFFFCSYGQLSVKGTHVKLSGIEGIDLVILYSQIDNSSEIHFKTPNPSVLVRWFTFSEGVKKEIYNYSKLSSTETYIDPKNNIGYIVNADGKETVFWVIDKSEYPNKEEMWCENEVGDRFSLDKKASQFTSNQHQLAQIVNQEIEEEIGCKITTETTARDAKNENQRPDATTLDGSAPLEVSFFSNPEGNVQNYLWSIFKDGSLIVTRTERDHQYTFTETGKYKITLQVSNGQQIATDSVEVSVSESKIAAPNVFTPNGDGVNDEFRVAYTSITEFQGTILNRWGRVVFSWTDPQIGWDGTINGKPAPEGTYFYVIKAKGSDGLPYLLKGHINLLR